MNRITPSRRLPGASAPCGPRRPSQRGVVLIEALIGILIFSMGVLALVGLQTVAVKATSQAQYRMEAQNLTDQLVGEMWISDPATRATRFASDDGVAYVNWRDNAVIPRLPGSNVATNWPDVVFAGNGSVTITVYWQSPGEPVHRYTVVTAF